MVSGLRTIGLTQRCVDILNEIRQENNIINSSDNLYFTSGHGNVILTDSYNRMLKNASKALNINKRVTAHTFRHTHITMLAEKCAFKINHATCWSC